MQSQINQFRDCKRKQKLFRIVSDTRSSGTYTFIPITSSKQSPVKQLRNKILYDNSCSTREAQYQGMHVLSSNRPLQLYSSASGLAPEK